MLGQGTMKEISAEMGPRGTVGVAVAVVVVVVVVVDILGWRWRYYSSGENHTIYIHDTHNSPSISNHTLRASGLNDVNLGLSIDKVTIQALCSVYC